MRIRLPEHEQELATLIFKGPVSTRNFEGGYSGILASCFTVEAPPKPRGRRKVENNMGSLVVVRSAILMRDGSVVASKDSVGGSAEPSHTAHNLSRLYLTEVDDEGAPGTIVRVDSTDPAVQEVRSDIRTTLEQLADPDAAQDFLDPVSRAAWQAYRAFPAEQPFHPLLRVALDIRYP